MLYPFINPSIHQSIDPSIQSITPSTQLKIQPIIDERQDPGAALLPIIDSRGQLAIILQNEGKTVGVEIGVQSGGFSETILKTWAKCEKYIMIDPWMHQEFLQVGAKVDSEKLKNNAMFQQKKKRLQRFEDNGVKLEYIRDLANKAQTQVPDDSLDFIYIDGRHDYKAVQEDLKLYWPKLRKGGIFAGPDFVDAFAGEIGRLYLDADGNMQEDNKGVKSAVEEFAKLHNRQIVVPRQEKKSATWYFRK